MAKPPEKSPTAGAPPNDLGFGSRVAREAGARFLERDGSFNVVREGVPLWRQLNPYHALTSISWPRFYALVLGLFLATNLLFAGLFFL